MDLYYWYNYDKYILMQVQFFIILCIKYFHTAFIDISMSIEFLRFYALNNFV